jgi:hypothetical protein
MQFRAGGKLKWGKRKDRRFKFVTSGISVYYVMHVFWPIFIMLNHCFAVLNYI